MKLIEIALVHLKNLNCLFQVARVVSCFSFVVAIFMSQENGDKQRPVK